MSKKLDILKAKLPKAPTGRRPIGYRGNHQHGKSLYDPVYPTTKIPTSLIPRYPIDWRNGGRFLLCVGLRRIENRIINKMKESQHFNLCECNVCNDNCIKIYNRCLCAWYCKYKYRHVYKCDNLLIDYKGEVKTEKPIFTLKKEVAKKNLKKSVEYIYNNKTKIFEIKEKDDIYKKFYQKIQENYSNKDHFSDSDSDVTDSDEEQ
ncbi:conserved Plasmodium protein, unknown function [Plasmodium relictum]|uniref:Uncharacterized protein n=1 Tax=Plasmodium relictum TaxID=85471 RepID=A0A1J1HBD3_PLARL|nr:conserved Plasmodium protein, unknown function [Plasmodium relictum]CRH02764.1 conserved Plasmodium protein, unknown function [Plasmodium relictum]